MKNLAKESQIKQYLRAQGFCLGIDFLQGLNQEITRLVNKAIDRAMKNSRKTVYERDV